MCGMLVESNKGILKEGNFLPPFVRSSLPQLSTLVLGESLWKWGEGTEVGREDLLTVNTHHQEFRSSGHRISLPYGSHPTHAPVLSFPSCVMGIHSLPFPLSA